MSDEAPAVLRASDARVAVDGVIAIERLTTESRGRRVLVAGDAEVLFALLTSVPLGARGDGAQLGPDDDEPAGEAQLVGGVLEVGGRDVGKREHHAVAGVAPLNPPMPLAWTAQEYAAWSARLAGAAEPVAREQAAAALEKVGLTRVAGRAIRTLSLVERRALALAAAATSLPDVVIAEAPLAGLDMAQGAFVLAAIAAVTDGRGAILSVGRLDPGTPEGTLARGATDVLVMAGGDVVLEGPPAELLAAVRVVALTVRTNAEPLRAELAARGIDLRGGPLRFAATLPSGTSTADVLAAADAARASVVQMTPLVV